MADKVIIFSAPSGSGKTTIVNHCLPLFPQLDFSVSATSRQPRGSEKDGVNYYFISAEEFRRRVDAGEFVEWEQVYEGLYYGTLKSEVERMWAEGKVIVFDVDVKGAYNLKKYFGSSALSVFIQAPSVEELRRRLEGRGTDSPEAINMRLAKAGEEMEFAKGKVDHILVNNDLDTAFKEAEQLISNFLNQ